MLVPMSWLKDYVDIDIPIELLAERMTLAGLEVAHLNYIGVPQAQVEGIRYPQSDHLVWDREKILLGVITAVNPHPNADRLVIATVDYGGDEPEQCVTGAPNLFQYREMGELETPVHTAIALEGAEVWDGHSDTPKRMILKGKELRGIYNKSMVCSEMELGISEEHEGIMLLEDIGDHPAGTPLQDVLGDVILDIELTPNLARCFSIVGVAREVAALLDKELRYPSTDIVAEGASIDGKVNIEIRESELNPRFTAALMHNVEIKDSPQWVQRRLKAVGQRPINNIVDITNYITFEIGQPTHAFDYDKLVERAGGTPTIITRLPEAGETLETLDEVKRDLQEHNILVTDTAGVLSLGGVIGGAETEISTETKTVLLEAAAWNFINIRRTLQAQKVFTDAGTRFSRGVHPSQAEIGVRRGIELMRQVSGGTVAEGIVDVYPNPPETVQVDLAISEVRRLLGMEFAVETAADILSRLQFDVTIEGDTIHATVPDHRMDISTGIIGQADLVEEIARIHGYDHIPVTIMEDAMPAQWANTPLELEERTRDILTRLGLRENISYRFTAPETEAQLVAPNVTAPEKRGYVEIANPQISDRYVLRHSLLVNLLENAAENARYQVKQQVFEIGNVYFATDDILPEEPRHLGVVIVGQREQTTWMGGDTEQMDFFDLKGVVEGLLSGLHIENASFSRSTHPTYHPGRSASLMIDGKHIGDFGEVHPLVAQAFNLEGWAVLAGEFDLDALLEHVNVYHGLVPLPTMPPVYEDIALVVPNDLPAVEVEAVIRQAGGELLKSVTLFDVYQGDSIADGHKSLAYSLVYQADDRTLKDKEIYKLRNKIIKSAEKRLGASLRA